MKSNKPRSMPPASARASARHSAQGDTEGRRGSGAARGRRDESEAWSSNRSEARTPAGRRGASPRPGAPVSSPHTPGPHGGPNRRPRTDWRDDHLHAPHPDKKLRRWDAPVAEGDAAPAEARRGAYRASAAGQARLDRTQVQARRRAEGESLDPGRARRAHWRVSEKQKEAHESADRRFKQAVHDMEMEPMRLQKALARVGVGARRDMEEAIAAGRVRVNGRVALLGSKVGPGDKVELDGRPVFLKWQVRTPRVILYHKPEGEIVSREDPQGRVSVFERLVQVRSSRWMAVGRLDFNTSGLLVFTDNGELAHRMMHPRFELEREYAVRILGELTPEQKDQLTSGVMLEDGPAKCERLLDAGGEGANHWYRVIIREGRNREVRRLFEFLGLTVSRLIRIRFGSLSLPARLKRGQWLELPADEVRAMLSWLDEQKPENAPDKNLSPRIRRRSR